MEKVDLINKKFEEICLEGEKKSEKVKEHIRELANFIRANHEFFDEFVPKENNDNPIDDKVANEFFIKSNK